MHIVYFNQVAVVKLYPSSQNVNCLIFHNFEKPDTFGAKSAFGNQTCKSCDLFSYVNLTSRINWRVWSWKDQFAVMFHQK